MRGVPPARPRERQRRAECNPPHSRAPRRSARYRCVDGFLIAGCTCMMAAVVTDKIAVAVLGCILILLGVESAGPRRPR